MDAGDRDGLPDCWCRLEMKDERVWRVHIMHPNGEILSSYGPDTFAPELLNRMQTGQIRADVGPLEEDGSRQLELRDGAGQIVFSDRML